MYEKIDKLMQKTFMSYDSKTFYIDMLYPGCCGASLKTYMKDELGSVEPQNLLHYQYAESDEIAFSGGSPWCTELRHRHLNQVMNVQRPLR